MARLLVLGSAVAVSTMLFADSHAEYSALNVATTAVSGTVWVILTLWSRSLLPAVAGHTVSNLMVL